MPSTRIKAALKESWVLDLTRWSYGRQVSNAVDAMAAELRKLPRITRITDGRKRDLKVLIYRKVGNVGFTPDFCKPQDIVFLVAQSS